MSTKRFLGLAIFAALLVIAGLYLQAHPSHLEALLAAAPGLMLANLPLAVPDLKGMLEGIAASVNTLKEKHATDLAELRREVERVESKGNMIGLVGGNKSDAIAPRPNRGSDAEMKAFGQFLKTGEKRFAMESKAMTVGSNPDGGYAVPIWFDEMVYRVAGGYTPLLDLVTRNTVSNFPARHVVSLGTGATGWADETGARPPSNSPTIAAVETAGGDLYANPQLSQWAIDDIRFNVVEWLAEEVGLSFGVALQNSIVSGNGTNKPAGFLAGTLALTSDKAGRAFGTVQYLKTGVAGGLPATTTALIDFLLNVVHALAPHYRQNASWLMNSTTLGELRKAKDTTNRPILLDSLVSGQPATLLGYPVYEIDDMSDLAANALPIALGDWKRGYILDEHETGLRVIVDQVTNKPYVGFYNLKRVGGKVLDSNAIKIVKCEV